MAYARPQVPPSGGAVTGGRAGGAAALAGLLARRGGAPLERGIQRAREPGAVASAAGGEPRVLSGAAIIRFIALLKTIEQPRSDAPTCPICWSQNDQINQPVTGWSRNEILLIHPPVTGGTTNILHLFTSGSHH